MLLLKEDYRYITKQYTLKKNYLINKVKKIINLIQSQTKILHTLNLEILRGNSISPSKSPGSDIYRLSLNLENLRGIVKLGLGRLKGIVT